MTAQRLIIAINAAQLGGFPHLAAALLSIYRREHPQPSTVITWTPCAASRPFLETRDAWLQELSRVMGIPAVRVPLREPGLTIVQVKQDAVGRGRDLTRAQLQEAIR